MVSDKLYKLATEYYKRKLWLEMEETKIFGLRLPAGEIAYCSVSGKDDDVIALFVFVGQESFETFRRAMFPRNYLEENEWLFLQVGKKCLSCNFESKDDLTEEELTAEKSFSTRNKIFFRGKNSHPRFLHCEPFICAESLYLPEEEKILELAFEAAIEVGKKYPDNLPKNISFPTIPPVRKKFPVLTPTEDGFKWTMEYFPPYRFPRYPAAKYGKSDIAKLKEVKKSGVYSCELYVSTNAVLDDEDKLLKFPVFMLSLNENKKALSIPMTLKYASSADNLIKSFIKECMSDCVPKKILVRNDRTFDYLENFCEEVGIELCEVEKFPELDDLKKILEEEEL